MMTDSPDANAAMIADLINKLADLSGDAAALASYRREADRFDPNLSTARIALELLALEAGGEGGREIRASVNRLLEFFRANERFSAADMIIDGLKKIDAVERAS